MLDLLDAEVDAKIDRRVGGKEYPHGNDLEPSRYATYSARLWDDQTATRESIETVWQQNILFLAGHQWMRFDPKTGTFQPPIYVRWKEKPVTNLLVPFFKNFMAKATKERPVSRCAPASTDAEDIASALLGDDVLRAKWQELRLNRIVRRIVAWVIATGNAFVMPYWNTDTGKIRPIMIPVEAVEYDRATGMPTGKHTIVPCPCDENGEPFMTEDGGYDLEREPLYEDVGEVGVRVLSPFQVRMNADAEGMEDVTWLLVAEPVALTDLERRWPDAPKDITPGDTTEIERFDAIVNGMPGTGAGDTYYAASSVRNEEDQTPKAFVLHYFERPCVDYPRGRHWVTTKHGQMLQEPDDLPDGIWPVILHVKEIEVVGRLLGEATLTAAVGLQREYNEANAFIKEHHNLLLRGKWLVPIGSNIRRGQITSEPGEVIQHTPGLPPKQADIKPLPAAVYEDRKRILEDFQHVSGFFKVSMGQAPPGVTAGRAFLTLQEADDSDFGPFLTELEDMNAELGWLLLQHIQANYDEERLIKVSGSDHSYRVRAFKGADLQGVLDVEPQRGSAFPWNQVAKQSMLMELAQTVPQAFTDPETGEFDVDELRRLLPVGGMQAVYSDSDMSIAQAQREEEEFEQWDGMSPLPKPMPWQSARQHLKSHARRLNSADFEKWPPENQQAFINHYLETEAFIQQAQMMAQARQAQAELMATGGAGGPPKNGGSNADS